MVASLTALSLILTATAQTKDARSGKVAIGNFGQINANYYRGGQPDKKDYADLVALGIKTVVDLRKGGKDEPKLVGAAGMKFYRIPMTASDEPSAAAIDQFLSIVTDPAAQPVFVHCRAGRHRTGVMTAVYRMTQDRWSADRAYAEMKEYHFEGFPGHPTLKKFVYDYYTKLLAKKPQAGAAQKSKNAGPFPS